MRTLFLFFLAILPFATHAQDYKAGYFIRGNDTLPYRLLLPEGYTAGKQYPLVLFLHGAGERGSDNERQLIHGGKMFRNDTLRREFPAIVLFPQCAANTSWAVTSASMDSAIKARVFTFPADAPPTKPSALLYQLLDSLEASGSVDTKRMYVGGLSMGGMGTFDILGRFPNRFAAAFPICGAGNEKLVGRYAKNTAVWIFHGADDRTVTPYSSRRIYADLRELGADVKYTEYPGVGHNSWDNAFAEKNLFPWLFSHRLK
ncbi:carboxylesterase family protein [Chitinophaga lutea]